MITSKRRANSTWILQSPLPQEEPPSVLRYALRTGPSSLSRPRILFSGEPLYLHNSLSTISLFVWLSFGFISSTRVLCFNHVLFYFVISKPRTEVVFGKLITFISLFLSVYNSFHSVGISYRQLNQIYNNVMFLLSIMDEEECKLLGEDGLRGTGTSMNHWQDVKTDKSISTKSKYVCINICCEHK